MRFLLMSDLHLEFGPKIGPTLAKINSREFDAVLLAGDIVGSPRSALWWAATERALAGKPILFTPGNHEFYSGRKTIEGYLAEMSEWHAASPDCDRLHCLAPGEAIVAGADGSRARVLGATLWTDYALDGDPDFSMGAAAKGLNDHVTIVESFDEDGDAVKLTPQDARRRHRADLAFLEERLAHPFDGPTIIMTHHAPHPGSIAPQFARSAFNPAFASDLTATIERFQPDAWIHGHIHHRVDYRVGKTRIVANPMGYPEENRRFEPLIITCPEEGA